MAGSGLTGHGPARAARHGKLAHGPHGCGPARPGRHDGTARHDAVWHGTARLAGHPERTRQRSNPKFDAETVSARTGMTEVPKGAAGNSSILRAGVGGRRLVDPVGRQVRWLSLLGMGRQLWVLRKMGEWSMLDLLAAVLVVDGKPVSKIHEAWGASPANGLSASSSARPWGQVFYAALLTSERLMAMELLWIEGWRRVTETWIATFPPTPTNPAEAVRDRVRRIYVRPMPVGLWAHARTPRDPRMHRAYVHGRISDAASDEADRDPRSPGQLRAPAPAAAANSAETHQFFQKFLPASGLRCFVGHELDKPAAPLALLRLLERKSRLARPRLFLPHRAITPACTTRAQQQHRPIHRLSCILMMPLTPSPNPYITTPPFSPRRHFAHHTYPSSPLLSSSSRLPGAPRLHSLPLSMMATAGCFQAGAAGSSRARRPLAWRPVLVLLLLLLVPSCCQATRGMQPFKGKPLDPGTANHFLGFLPRGLVPPSGPSRQHNSIGAQDQSHPQM
ncbi:hypothetical protein HU200_038750 [Digitaria exilis]|uniref:Uncharacterized protein n=1 Tax=Digitaria exilis TaxID=1010633 RepID=A0A835EHU6_9POAL|nr:hypothetical protein HU200_038750 [Digitaria exilis]